MNKKYERFWEIDLIRGIAVVLMIIFHFIFDLNYFSVASINTGIWFIFARVTASIFIILVGISLTLSFSRAKHSGIKKPYMKYIRRGSFIFSLGLVITVVTWLFFRNEFIVFGVLHFIGLSIIIAYPFLRFKYANLVLGIFFICIGIFLQNFSFTFPYLLWIGFIPHNFYTFDYFPLLPWFGLILTGIFLGNTLYRGYVRRYRLHDMSGFLFSRLFCFLGRHSLLIYFAHQPVLIILLQLFVGIHIF